MPGRAPTCPSLSLSLSSLSRAPGMAGKLVQIFEPINLGFNRRKLPSLLSKKPTNHLPPAFRQHLFSFSQFFFLSLSLVSRSTNDSRVERRKKRKRESKTIAPWKYIRRDISIESCRRVIPLPLTDHSRTMSVNADGAANRGRALCNGTKRPIKRRAIIESR